MFKFKKAYALCLNGEGVKEGRRKLCSINDLLCELTGRGIDEIINVNDELYLIHFRATVNQIRVLKMYMKKQTEFKEYMIKDRDKGYYSVFKNLKDKTKL